LRAQAPGSINFSWPHLDLVYSLVWSLLALFIPLIILTVCNVCLIRALQQSRRLQSQCRASCRSESGITSAGAKTATGSGNSGHQRITPTLVALIVVFTVCVGPSGLLEKFRTPSLGGTSSTLAVPGPTVIRTFRYGNNLPTLEARLGP